MQVSDCMALGDPHLHVKTVASDGTASRGGMVWVARVAHDLVVNPPSNLPQLKALPEIKLASILH
jgi:hypothetical protein